MSPSLNKVYYYNKTVPYALRPAVEKELRKTKDEGIIEPVEVGNCAIPIVCVPKTDGSVGVCGDY